MRLAPIEAPTATPSVMPSEARISGTVESAKLKLNVIAQAPADTDVLPNRRPRMVSG
jgi:hypothetical protein